MPRRQTTRLLLFVLTIALLALVHAMLVRSGITQHLTDSNTLSQWLQTPGAAGPVIIITLMALAIIMSPIPSAPIALAAGAVYGHAEGTVYIVIGAELGAIGAFSIARLLGVDVLQKWFGGGLSKNPPGSQNSLMAMVFFSRLLPFVSFDMVSYAAGLTSLSYGRFAVATLAGIIPASFLLAHFGAEMASADSKHITTALLLLGIFFAVPFIARAYRRRRSVRK